MTRHLNILGTRGVPGRHGGYETFASRFAPYMVERGWTVTVYCQSDVPARRSEDVWKGVRRVHYGPRTSGTLGTMEFDARTVAHVLGNPGIDLVLGYNTAVFNLAQRMRGRKIIFNMDGIEWLRGKWSLPAKAWFFLNELAGAQIGQHLIADHPEIENHLRRRSRRPITMIPYGADRIDFAPEAPVRALGLEPGKYMVKIARPTPENSVLEIIRAFSVERRSSKLVVLGSFDENDSYHRACVAAAGPDILFPGAIFDEPIVSALRYHALAYFHGHTVGGTNPSLCEALGAGNPIIAHDNRFNRWTAGEGQFFFSDERACATAITKVLDDVEARKQAQIAAYTRHAQVFTWPAILEAYEALMERLA